MTDPALLSVVYSSTATRPFRDADLAELLAASRMANERRGLSGLLLHRDGRFLQVLEGPEDVVRRLLDVIAHDPRHTDVRIEDEERVHERRFGRWSMAYRSVAPGSDWFGSTGAAPVDGSRAAAMLHAFRSGEELAPA